MPKNLLPIIAALFVMLFLWVSTVPILSWYEYSGHEEELRDATDRWERSGVSSYRYRYQIDSYMASPVTDPVIVEISDKQLRSVRSVMTGKFVELAESPNVPLTIEDLYNTIAVAIATRPYAIEIAYDFELGFPTSISIDYNELTHDEVSYSVTGFEELASGD